MCDMAGRSHWGVGGGYLDLLCKRQHWTCETRSHVKAPTETAIPSARVRSILHISDDTLRGNFRGDDYENWEPQHGLTLTGPCVGRNRVPEENSQEVYKEWTERSRPMCPCSSGLLAAHPAAAGIFLCRRSSCVNQILSLEEVDSTVAIPLSCEAQFPIAVEDSIPKLNPNAPEFVPGFMEASN